jgi:hypothetical protein
MSPVSGKKATIPKLSCPTIIDFDRIGKRVGGSFERFEFDNVTAIHYKNGSGCVGYSASHQAGNREFAEC